MIKHVLIGSALSCLLTGQALALDGKAYEATWAGQMKDGEPVSMTISAGVANGGAVSYSYNNQNQGPQTPTVQKNKIRLDNPSGTYIVIGPVKGSHLPLFWTDGKRTANAVLTKQ
jgi:hypothetical protein